MEQKSYIIGDANSGIIFPKILNSLYLLLIDIILILKRGEMMFLKYFKWCTNWFKKEELKPKEFLFMHELFLIGGLKISTCLNIVYDPNILARMKSLIKFIVFNVVL